MDAATNHRQWAERSGEFSPTYYAQLGPNKVSKSLVTVLESLVDKEASILEIGCSSGRHLAHLLDNGFENLSGLDINDESFEVMAEHFPPLAEQGTFYTGTMERLLPGFADDEFDVVYSVETLQHVHADDVWVFRDVARITGQLLVTVENEGNDEDSPEHGENVRLINDEFPIYYRDWNRIFTSLGLEQRLERPSKRDTIRVFESPVSDPGHRDG